MVATAVVAVKVYAVEKRVPEPVMGAGKRSERAYEGSHRQKSRSGHTRVHGSIDGGPRHGMRVWRNGNIKRGV